MNNRSSQPDPVDQPDSISSKPRSKFIRPEITRLPGLSFSRRIVRRLIRMVCRVAIAICTKAQIAGLENFPSQGPALVVINHLGDADLVLGLAFFPDKVEGMVKMELYDFPLLGTILDAYGAIWLHRGQPDRRALRVALKALEEGRMVGIAPEGRESLTGSLEEGMGGAAYLALKAGVPIIPVVVTNTENNRIYGNLKRLRRTRVSLEVGKPFRLTALPEQTSPDERRQAIKDGTDLIMLKLAEMLPPEYRGVYDG